jgi:7-cyano-7-deazaguanine reductase
MIYSHLTERFKPEQLMVACLYTRRGGIDINPIRASHQMLIPEFFTNPMFCIRKTLRQ